MQLSWRPVGVREGGPFVVTAITAPEAAALGRLAYRQRVAEVGSAYGYSTVVLARSADFVVSIDPHKDFLSAGTLMAALDAAGVAGNVAVVAGESVPALAALGRLGATFDGAFIDGDHEEAAVRADLKAALRVVRPGGWVALHDYGEDSCPGVLAAVNEACRAGRLVPRELVDTLFVAGVPGG